MDILGNKKEKWNAILFCGSKDAGLERSGLKYYYNSIKWKQTSGMD